MNRKENPEPLFPYDFTVKDLIQIVNNNDLDAFKNLTLSLSELGRLLTISVGEQIKCFSKDIFDYTNDISYKNSFDLMYCNLISPKNWPELDVNKKYDQCSWEEKNRRDKYAELLYSAPLMEIKTESSINTLLNNTVDFLNSDISKIQFNDRYGNNNGIFESAALIFQQFQYDRRFEKLWFSMLKEEKPNKELIQYKKLYELGFKFGFRGILCLPNKESTLTNPTKGLALDVLSEAFGIYINKLDSTKSKPSELKEQLSLYLTLLASDELEDDVEKMLELSKYQYMPVWVRESVLLYREKIKKFNKSK